MDKTAHNSEEIVHHSGYLSLLPEDLLKSLESHFVFGLVLLGLDDNLKTINGRYRLQR